MLPPNQPPKQDRRIALYDDPHSLYCCKTKVVLRAKGVSYTTRHVACGYTSSPEFTKIAPLGKIPVLIVEEAELKEPLVICESEAINEWLEDDFPESAGYVRLMPFRSALRASARSLSRFHDLHLEAALRKTYPQVPRRTRNAAAVDAAAAEYTACLTKLEALLKQADAVTASLLPPGAALQPPAAAEQCGTARAREHAGYAVGRQLSLADAGFGPTFLYADIVFGALGVDRIEREARAGEWPRVAALRSALFSDPHVAAVLKELQPAANEWLESKLVQ